jgi:hypothetical protein
VPENPPDRSPDDAGDVDRQFMAVFAALTIIWLIAAYGVVDWFYPGWLPALESRGGFRLMVLVAVVPLVALTLLAITMVRRRR